MVVSPEGTRLDVDALLFDFGGTLDADGVPWKDRFYRLFRDEAADLSAAAFDRLYYDSDDAIVDRRDSAASYTTTVHELARALAREVGMPGAATRVAERFLEDARAKISENLCILRRLSRRYRIGVVSNFYGNLDAALRETGLDEVVEAAADSSLVGVTKPDGAIFRYTLDALGVAPARALMVGDSTRRDVEGARRLGMPYRLLLRADRLEAPADVDPACVIRSLAQLEETLS
jgi:putative hydrolase of the HAD superfamily